MENLNITPFVREDFLGEGKIRKVWHEEQWFFSVIDIIRILSETTNPTSYWSKVQKTILNENELVPFWHKLKLPGQDGKFRPSDCANTEGVFRIIMSVPSPKAEPLRVWLAQVGAERIEETENPELSYERMAEIYRAKGRSEVWIKERLQSIATRNELTDEWKARGIKEGQEYGILTATIAKGALGLTPNEHKELKGLDKQNLRDHMTRLELIITSLSEEVTRIITVREDAQGFNANQEAAVKGGIIGGRARQNLEADLGEKVVSPDNFLTEPKNEQTILPPSADEP